MTYSPHATAGASARARAARAVLVLSAATWALAACAADEPARTTATSLAPSTSAPPDPVVLDGASITIALTSAPTSLDPHTVDDGSERAIDDNVYEALLGRDADGVLVPLLADELPRQVDPTTWEFHLRAGVTFHDGTPFGADAVVASVERMMRLIAGDATEQRDIFSSITGADAVDDRTVRITTEGPDGALPARMYLLKIVPPTATADADLSAAPIGTGPYRFVRRDADGSVELAASPSYWGGTPSIANVTFAFVDDRDAIVAGLGDGTYDLATNLSAADLGRVPQPATRQGQEHPVLVLDADEGITADARVRRALNLAVDKQAIVDDVYGGNAVVDPGQVLSPSIIGHDDTLEAYPYDPDEARRLLDAAGAVGDRITLVGESSGRWLDDRELVEAVAADWRAVGLDVDLQLPPFADYLDVLFGQPDRPDAIFVSSSNELLDPSRQLQTYYDRNGIGASNSNTVLSDLIERGRSELDEAERDRLYQQAVRVAYDNAYFVWLVNNEDLYGMSARLRWTPRADSKLLVQEMAVVP